MMIIVIIKERKTFVLNEQKVGMLLQTLHKLKVWMTIVESGWNVWVWLVGVVSRRWVWLVGVASGSGWNLWVWLLGVVVRRYIDFLILLIPTPLVFVLFCSSIPTFCLNVFRSCSSTFLKLNFYRYKIIFSLSINTYLQLRASHGIHIKAAHTVLYMKKHTQTYASYPAMDITWCRSRSRGRALYRDASRAGRVRTGPASFKEQRSRTRRQSHCMPRRLRIRAPRLPRARYRVMAS